MEYKKYSKAQQVEFLDAQISDLEVQHFQHSAFAAAAEAAAAAEPDDQPDHESYVASLAATAKGHRRSVGEAERRINALRAMVALLDDKAPSTKE